MATGLYWCLVLTECLSLIVCGKCILLPIYYCISTASLTQTIPPYTPVCPGGRLVFTCITGVSVVWRGDNGGIRALINISPANTVDSFSLTVADYDSTTLVTNATIESVPVQLNGANISCSSDQGKTYETLYISIAGIKSLS